jgi:transposase
MRHKTRQCASLPKPKLRREAAVKLVESGLSRREAAKILGVDHRTIGRDLGQDSPESGEGSPTDELARSEKRKKKNAKPSGKRTAKRLPAFPTRKVARAELPP